MTIGMLRLHRLHLQSTLASTSRPRLFIYFVPVSVYCASSILTFLSSFNARSNSHAWFQRQLHVSVRLLPYTSTRLQAHTLNQVPVRASLELQSSVFSASLPTTVMPTITITASFQFNVCYSRLELELHLQAIHSSPISFTPTYRSYLSVST